MCDFEKGFILCTCDVPKVVVHNKNSRRYKRQQKQAKKAEYVWTLKSYIGPSQLCMEGLYYMPFDEIGNGLTAEFVVQQLNDKNCFDFEYMPNEGDNLSVRLSDSYSERMEFIFNNKQWIIKHYSPFDVEMKLLFNGRIKDVKTEEE